MFKRKRLQIFKENNWSIFENRINYIQKKKIIKFIEKMIRGKNVSKNNIMYLKKLNYVTKYVR